MALIQATLGAGSGNSYGLAFASAVTSGNTIIVAASIYNFNGNTAAITDSRGNTYTQVGTLYYTDFDTAQQLGVWYAYNVTGGTCTVTCNPAGADAAAIRISIHEYSGMATGDPYDKTARADSSAGSTSVSTGNTATLSQAAELVFGAMNTYDTDTIAYGTGYTQATENEDASTMSINTEYKVVAATTAVAATWTISPSDQWWAIVATFKLASGTAYTQAVSGAMTPSGILSRVIQAKKTGGITPAGTLARRLSRTLTGATTPTGALARRLSRALSGTLTASGTLSRVTGKALAGVLSSAGQVTRLISRILAGELTPTGALAAAKIVLVALSGVMTSAGDLVRSIGATKTGSLTPTGNVSKNIATARAGEVTSSGALTRRTSKALSGELSSSGTITRVIGKSLSGALTSVGNLSRSIGKFLQGALGSVGNLFSHKGTLPVLGRGRPIYADVRQTVDAKPRTVICADARQDIDAEQRVGIYAEARPRIGD